MELSLRETVLAAIVVLLMGRALTHYVGVLRRYNIPQPVSGGLFASLLALLAHQFWGLELHFDMALRDALLLAFFTTIGLSARLDTLSKGGRPLAVLMVFCVGGVILQNLVGLGMAQATGLEPVEGLLLGSVSLFGGHGTSVAWAGVFESQAGVTNALEIGIGSATLGLVMGGIVGGPMAQRLIEKHGLKSVEPVLDSKPRGESSKRRIDSQGMFVVLMYVSAGMIIGSAVSDWAGTHGVNLPEFLACLLAGLVLTNTLPRLVPRLEAPSEGQSLPLLSEITLGLFLSMSLMGMQLWTLVDLALPMLLTVVAQVLAMLVMVRFLLFPLLGRSYDSAVLCAGYMGMGLGALPNAMANMNALVARYGAAPLAFMILPLANAFFVDISNALVLQLMLNTLLP
ncbi:sodium/glutamate symporter [Ferrimonas balearica]|uniref:sodium/glutamate symporter n=1 Tax=Ferrimonas balearica TaxID=44012 RepID=UPI001C9963C0|nr:sodium/glutamate symporter [Ferrimonas balearica]MBY5993803.1 sodium/glutamate symporter [Ferrimonas balearica]